MLEYALGVSPPVWRVSQKLYFGFGEIIPFDYQPAGSPLRARKFMVRSDSCIQTLLP
jgi:hypothetical protein